MELTFEKDYPFIIYRYRIPSELKALHLHNCFEIGLIENGAGAFHVDRKSYQFRAGDIFVISRLEAHRARTNGGASDALFIYVSDTFLENVVSFTGERTIYGLFSLAGIANQYRDEGDASLIRGVFTAHTADHRPLVRSMMAELLVRIAGRYRRVIQSARGTDDFGDSLLAVYEHINRNFSHGIDADELAAIAGQSPSHFRRLFKRYAGTSPRDYITARRLKNAYLLIHERGMKAAEAARESGFQSYALFHRLFTREYKMPPVAVKRSGKKGKTTEEKQRE
ncbi:MAG: AraC family transcriptional regulator [Spirochaetota bacterium]